MDSSGMRYPRDARIYMTLYAGEKGRERDRDILTIDSSKAHCLDIGGIFSSDSYICRLVSNNSNLKVRNILIDTERRGENV